jgi:Xaa-Pro aminopeptidase
MELDQAKMVNEFERIDVFSSGEYRRRINGIRSIMKDKNVRTLIFLEAAEETYAQWMLGVRFLEYIIVPSEDDVIGVLWDELDESGCKSHETADYKRYLIQKPVTPVCEGIRFINRIADEGIVELLSQMSGERLGVVAPKRMTKEFADAMKEKMPHTELVDLSVDVALFRAVKSREEFEAIQISVDTQKKVFEALPAMIRPGRTAHEITYEMRYMLAQMGASGTLSCDLVNNGPTNDMLSEHSDLGDRRIEYGDRLFALMEANGPGQQHAAFGRHLVLGDPDDEMLKAVHDEIRAHKYAASLMKADGKTTLSQIAVKTRKYVNRMGYQLQEQIGWNWMHSLGAFIYEQYSLEDYTEDIPLRENTILHCHPLIYNYLTVNGQLKRREVFILNTYKVTAGGPVDLIDIPFEPVVIR